MISAMSKVTKYGLVGGGLTCLLLASAVYFRFFNTVSKADSPGGSPYSLSIEDIDRLAGRAKRGDCEAAKGLTRYYFDVASSLKNGTQWQRIAATNCPDVDTQVDLARLLIHYRTDSAGDREIADLIEKIRALDPARAAEVEAEFRKMTHSDG